MKFELKKTPKNPIIIEGFPSFGLASTIATEFLIKHLHAEKIGRVISDKLTPIVALHEGKPIDPIEIFHDKKNNLMILRALTDISNNEWLLVKLISDLVEKTNAKEIISLEGIAESKLKNSNLFYFTNSDKKKKDLEKAGLKQFNEGIVRGVTAGLILNLEKSNNKFSAFFVESNPNFPDSKAAGEIVRAVNTYLGTNINPRPLIKSGQEFEKKLKGYLEKSKKHKIDNNEAKGYVG